MTNDIERIFFDEAQISKRVHELTDEINAYYGDNPIIVIFVLKGSVFFAADIIRNLKMDTRMEFMSVSSYGEETISSGKLTIKKDLECDVSSRDVLLIEDIIDTGITLSTITKLLLYRGAKSVRTVTMLSKPSRRQVPFNADFTGFEIEDEFVVGYGMDYNDLYRNLPYIGSLKRNIYKRGNMNE